MRVPVKDLTPHSSEDPVNAHKNAKLTPARRAVLVRRGEAGERDRRAAAVTVARTRTARQPSMMAPQGERHGHGTDPRIFPATRRRFPRYRRTVQQGPTQRQETQIVQSCLTLDHFLPGFTLPPVR